MRVIINKKPIVSVIIDTYNHTGLIESAIESVLNQTFPQNEMEIIVIDDGSTDNTPERVKKYKDKIKYIYKNNEGQASALNAGFKEAKGEYIVLLDGDDYCKEKRVERIVEEFEKYEEVVCVLNTREVINEMTGRIINESFPNFHNLELNEKNLNHFIKSSYGTSRTSLRKSVLKYVLPIPKDLIIEADLYLNLSIIWFGNLSCINEKLTVYRIHGRNLFCLSDLEKLPLQIRTMKIALRDVKNTARKSKIYNKRILKEILKPYEIEIKEKEIILNSYKNRAKRKDIISLELEKIKFYKKEWNFLYKFYKYLRLPLFVAFSPALLIKFKDFYYRNKLYKIRKFIFPD